MHPTENDLALYSSGDTNFVQTFRLKRHVVNCDLCREAVAEYRALSVALAEEPAIPNWDNLAAEMGANIRLGLEAGACVQPSREPSLAFWNPRLTAAFASLAIVAAAGLALRQKPKPVETNVITAQQSVKVDTEGVTITNVYAE